MFDMPNFLKDVAGLLPFHAPEPGRVIDSVTDQSSTAVNSFLTLPGALVDAQMVIGLRTLGLLGVVAFPLAERVHMVAEKPAALSQGIDGLSRAVWAGKGPADQAQAFIEPATRKVRDNHVRLRHLALTETNKLERASGVKA